MAFLMNWIAKYSIPLIVPFENVHPDILPSIHRRGIDDGRIVYGMPTVRVYRGALLDSTYWHDANQATYPEHQVATDPQRLGSLNIVLLYDDGGLHLNARV